MHLSSSRSDSVLHYLRIISTLQVGLHGDSNIMQVHGGIGEKVCNCSRDNDFPGKSDGFIVINREVETGTWEKEESVGP